MSSVLSVGAPDVAFSVCAVTAVAGAAVPTISFGVRVDADGREVSSIALNVQLRLDATRRRYAPADETLLLELFGGRERWGQTLRSLLWATTSLTVPRFTGQTVVEVTVPATYDFDVLAAKYLNALTEGEVPVELLFSGTVFYEEGKRLQAAPVSWEREAQTTLPLAVWREALDAAFPGEAWLRVRRDVFERLWAYRAARALPGWEATFDELLGDHGR